MLSIQTASLVRLSWGLIAGKNHEILMGSSQSQAALKYYKFALRYPSAFDNLLMYPLHLLVEIKLIHI